MNKTTPWFALQTKSRNERSVERLLTQKGYECFLPTYCRKRRWSDRVVEIESPLFPMYIFCRFHSSALGKAISTPGVTRIVGFGGQFAEVEVEEISSLLLLSQSRLLREPWSYIPDGTRVQVETGPLAGAKGIFNSDKDSRKLIISVAILQRSVAVQLDEKTLISVIEGPKGTAREDGSMALKLMERAADNRL